MHNPDGFADVRGGGVDLVLSGHTHGGQVKPPFMPPPVLPVRNRKYAAGLFREEGTAMYVSRGVGMILKWRLNCRPEVAYVVLRR
jgi:predicted MPP superfamily phosphohydrolase